MFRTKFKKRLLVAPKQHNDGMPDGLVNYHCLVHCVAVDFLVTDLLSFQTTKRKKLLIAPKQHNDGMLDGLVNYHCLVRCVAVDLRFPDFLSFQTTKRNKNLNIVIHPSASSRQNPLMPLWVTIVRLTLLGRQPIVDLRKI
jgi:hypothetical protein